MGIIGSQLTRLLRATLLVAVWTSVGELSPVMAVETGKATVEKELPPPYKTAGKFSHAVQKYSGLNYVSERVAGAAATAATSIYLRGRAHVKVRSYNFTDLLKGKFRSVDVHIANGKTHGVPIGAIHAHSTTPFQVNYLPFGKNRLGLKTPVLVALDGQISEKLVSKGLKSKAVTENLRFLKLDLPGLGSQRLQVLNPEVSVQGDRVHVRANLITAGAAPDTGVLVNIAAHPSIEQERLIMLKDIEVQCDAIEDPKSFAAFAEDLLNPLLDFARMDRMTHAFRVTDFSVKNQRVTIGGRLLLAPKPKAVAAAPATSSSTPAASPSTPPAGTEVIPDTVPPFE